MIDAVEEFPYITLKRITWVRAILAHSSECVKLNVLRVLIRLTKDVKAIDNKKYIALETNIDEIGRMLGGWIRSTKER